MTVTIDNEIEKLNKQIEALVKQKEELNKLTEAQKIAKVLHEKLCNANHTDGCGWYGCGWYYEAENGIDKWEGNTHKEYLYKANKLLVYNNRFGYEDVINFLNCIK